MTLPSFRVREGRQWRRFPGLEEIMHMTEPNNSLPERRTIPCHWVQEEGFEVLPVPVSGQDPGVLRDTAFLLKPAVPAANVRYPAA